MISTVLFDFFGTLVSYEEGAGGDEFRESWRMFRSFGGVIDYDQYLSSWNDTASVFEVEATRTLVEYPLESVVQEFLQRHGADCGRTEEFLRAFINDWNRAVTFTADDISVIRSLAEGHRLGVVTNTHLTWLVPEHLDRMGVTNCISDVVMSIEVGFRKPHPRMFHEALRRMRATAHETLFVGDSAEADVAGAKAVGLRAVRIDRNGSGGFPDCIGSLAEVAAVISGHSIGSQRQ
ncbi:MAG: HAD family hydrolase [Dehalococcoidia bacterium]